MPADAGERGRLADRAAGVGAGGRRAPGARRPRPPSRPSCRRARAPGPTGCAPGRSSEFSLDEPIANSSSWSCRRARCRRACSAVDDVRVEGRGEVRRASASRRSCGRPAVTRMSLCAIGMPVSGPRVAGARAPRRPPARRRSAPSASTVMKAFSAALCARDAREQRLASARRWRSVRVQRGGSSARVRSARDEVGASGMRAGRRGRCAPRSLDHLGHEIQAVLDGRRDGSGRARGGRARSPRRRAAAASRPARAPSARRRWCRPRASSSIRPKIASSLARTSSASRGVDLDAREMGDAVDVGAG